MSDLTYALFLGCVIPYREVSYEASARKVAGALGIELQEMPDANCCGLPIDPANHRMMLVLAARNLCIAEQMGLNIMTLCNGCTGALKKVNKKLKNDRELRTEVNDVLKDVGVRFEGKIEVKHFIQVLSKDLGLEELKKFIVKPLSHLKIAGFYGCHIFRPSKYMDVENPEDPSLLRDLIGITGARSMNYVDELQCCGATCANFDRNVPLYLAREKLRNVKSVGADAMVTLCPSCHIVLDANQPWIERTFSEDYKIPVLHYPQLLGLAMGIGEEDLALEDLRVKPTKILGSLG